jgi:hypothetical protein
LLARFSVANTTQHQPTVQKKKAAGRSGNRKVKMVLVELCSYFSKKYGISVKLVTLVSHRKLVRHQFVPISARAEV